MQDKLKHWLGSGSIDIFGMPFSGKETQGKRLAELVDGVFLSSGDIIRKMEQETGQALDNTDMVPSHLFYRWVLPYFEHRDLWDKPLILSSFGSWVGEEGQVLNTALASGHPIKVVIYLRVSEAEIKKRWEKTQARSNQHSSDKIMDLASLEKRIQEFNYDTLPALRHYRDLGLIKIIDGEGSPDEVFERIIKALAKS